MKKDICEKRHSGRDEVPWPQIPPTALGALLLGQAIEPKVPASPSLSFYDLVDRSSMTLSASPFWALSPGPPLGRD